MSTEAGLWALVVLLAVLVVVLLALLLRAHQSNELAAKSQPTDSQRAAAASTRPTDPAVTPGTATGEGGDLRRRNVGAEALHEREPVPFSTAAAAAVSAAAGPRSPSRLQPPGRQASSRQEADTSEDGVNRYEASLDRGTSNVAWGFAWNVAALAMKRLILAGVDPASPAGAWNAKRKEDGSQPMQRGDEVVAVNDVTSYSEMRKELAIPALEVHLRLVIEAASADTSPNRDALRRKVGSSKASSASGRSNESSPMHTTSPKSEHLPREDSKPRSPQMPIDSDHVKVKNTFIEVEDAPEEEEEPASLRFTQSDPTPVLEAMRNTTTTTCSADLSQHNSDSVLPEAEAATPSEASRSELQEPEPAKTSPPETPSPGRRKPTPLSEDSEISETPAPLPASSPREEGTSWMSETPEAFGFGGHPLLLEHLLPEDAPIHPEPPRVPSPAPVPLAFPPPQPVLQYAPPMGARLTAHVQEASERSADTVLEQRTSKTTLPLPPGALPPGPVGTSPISEASQSDGANPCEGSPGDSEESETEVTSPESRRKPTRRGGRRARHRKMAALARQQAAEAEEMAAKGHEAPAQGPTSPPGAGNRPCSPTEVPPSMSSSSSPVQCGFGGLTVSSEDGVQLIGRMVLIQGLLRSPEFNGQWGHVESYDPQMQRFLVSVVLPTQLPGEAPLYAKLRRDNLIVPHPEMHLATSPVPAFPSREVRWPAEPAFIQEHILPPFQPASTPGPAADFEDSVGAALMMPLGARIQPGGTLEDSGSLGSSPPQDPLGLSRPSMGPDMLSPEVRQMWLNQGSAADFEDSVVGHLFDSPKAASRGGSSPSSKLKRFAGGLGGFSYAEGTAADFEDSIGGTAGWPDLLNQRKEEEAATAAGPLATGPPGWQPTLRPRS